MAEDTNVNGRQTKRNPGYRGAAIYVAVRKEPSAIAGREKLFRTCSVLALFPPRFRPIFARFPPSFPPASAWFPVRFRSCFVSFPCRFRLITPCFHLVSASFPPRFCLVSVLFQCRLRQVPASCTPRFGVVSASIPCRFYLDFVSFPACFQQCHKCTPEHCAHPHPESCEMTRSSAKLIALRSFSLRWPGMALLLHF